MQKIKLDQSKVAKKRQKRDEIKMFTDGSCMKNGLFNKCGYGVYFPDKEVSNISKPFVHEPLTNQRSELYAIYKGIKRVKKHCTFNKLIIYSDSEYSIKSLTEWITNWKKNGWKTANKKPVLNVDIIKKIDRYMQKYEGKIIFHHVKSHTGKLDALSIGNDKADELAKAGANKLN